MKTFSPSRVRAKRPVGPAGLAAALGLTLAGAAQAQVLPPDPSPTCTVPSAEFRSWFPGSPGPDQPVRPADSAKLDTNNNCNFYKWSEQMFLWATSPVAASDPAKRVFGSGVFYQVEGDKLVQMDGKPLQHLFLRAAKSGPDGLPIVIDSEGRLRQFVAAQAERPENGKALAAAAGARPPAIASVRTGSDGKAVFLDAAGKPVAGPKAVTPDMLPPALGRLSGLAAPSNRDAALATATATGTADERASVAKALTAKGVLIEVETASGAVFVEAGTDKVQSLAPGQAGGNGVLVSQQRSIVYYQTLVNDVYKWYLTGRTTRNGIAPYYFKDVVNGADPKKFDYGLFPTTTGDLDAVVDFARTHGGPTTFSDGQALAMEVKLAWVDAAALPDGAKGYITAQAEVPDYDQTNPTSWPHLKPRSATVALVGAHIVGSTAGHPEMVWATFEHQSNTPLAQYDYYKGAALQPQTVPLNTSGTWLFSATGASSDFNKQLAMYCPQSDPKDPKTPPVCVNKPDYIVAVDGVPAIKPNDLLRQKAWGVASNAAPNKEDATPAASNTEIVSINTDVRAQLAAAKAGADPRFNYLLIGATWTTDGGEPTCSYARGKCDIVAVPPLRVQPIPNQIGTSMLENSTMETFHQGSDTTASGKTLNCLDCHNSSGYRPERKADTFVSHVFQGLALALGPSPKGAK